MTPVAEEKGTYTSDFARLHRNGRTWLDRLRREAIGRFEAMGFPTTRDEEWRFTNVAPIARTAFQLAGAVDDIDISATLQRSALPGLEDSRLVFVNGHFSAKHSRLPDLPAGVRIGSLAAALNLAEPHLGRYIQQDGNPFAALNTAFIQDGAFVHLPRGTVLDRPVHLLFVSVGGGEPVVSHPRILIVAQDNVQASFIEHYVGQGGGYFTNTATELIAGRDCRIEHVKLQHESTDAYHVASLRFELGPATRFDSHKISLGGRLVRNDLHAMLGGERVEAILNGLYILGGNQHLDNHMTVEHASPNCESHELYKGVLDGQSSAVFKGIIHVWKDAQKTDAKQTNKNLLLSDDATVDTLPSLRIFADDVKCTHGATIGQLDDEQLFYLRSRGIPLAEARNLLTYAFAADVVERIGAEAVRRRLESMLLARHHLSGELITAEAR